MRAASLQSLKAGLSPARDYLKASHVRAFLLRGARGDWLAGVRIKLLDFGLAGKGGLRAGLRGRLLIDLADVVFDAFEALLEFDDSLTEAAADFGEALAENEE